MYSLVLMTALATTAEVPDCHWRHGCAGWGCHGCWGGWGCHGCWGGWGCHGGYGCSGCYVGWGCSGCNGCWGCACYGTPYRVVPMAPAAPAAPPAAPPAKPAEAAPPPVEKKGDQPALAPNQARLLVQLPDDARLFIDDQLMKTGSTSRTFNTPPLQVGYAYYYIARAELVINGRTFTETKQVIVRPGQTSQVTFSELLALRDANARPQAAGAQ